MKLMYKIGKFILFLAGIFIIISFVGHAQDIGSGGAGGFVGLFMALILHGLMYFEKGSEK